MGVCGESIVKSVSQGDARASIAIRLGAGSPPSPAWEADTEVSALPNIGAFAMVGDASSSFFSRSFASSPSTLFKSASSTSVFGPRFFGTASI